MSGMSRECGIHAGLSESAESFEFRESGMSRECAGF